MELEHHWILDQFYRQRLQDRIAEAAQAAQLREIKSDRNDPGVIRMAIGATMVRVGSWIGGAPIRAYVESAGTFVTDC